MPYSRPRERRNPTSCNNNETSTYYMVVACEADGRQLGRQGAELPVGDQRRHGAAQLAPEGGSVGSSLAYNELR